MSEVAQTDVLVIGGGINGAGTFRDLCEQGVDCVLIERGDFCSGASAASSRLMHGGLKYLETGEFRLVRESLVERNRLLANAPHVVSPLPTILPLRSRLGGIGPSVLRFLGRKADLRDRGSVITRLGLTLYDLYGRSQRAMPTHRILGRRALGRRVRGLDAGIIAAGLYFEGQLSHAERLGLELLLDGERANPASRALSHARITETGGGVVTFVRNGKPQRLRPKVIVNAGGAWIDAVNRDLGLRTALMGGSKGSHLVVDNPALHAALNGHMVYFGTSDGRVNLCYPFMGKVLVGATDLPVPDPDTAACDAGEVAYLIAAVAKIFPDMGLADSQVRYRFCGVRPLPRSDGPIGAVSRDHAVARLELDGGTPVLCLIGGKWTTFRAFSEQAADEVLGLLGRPRRVRTERLPIGGGAGFPRGAAAQGAWAVRVAGETGLSPERVATLLGRYGTGAQAVAEACRDETPLVSLPGWSRQELAHLCRTERVVHLPDLLLRRTLIALSGHLDPAVIAEAAEVAAGVLGWTAARRTEEEAAMAAHLEGPGRTPHAAA
jgi:glycerol-3-phosphate dehydrogenase